jgi:hypothetical protein
MDARQRSLSSLRLYFVIGAVLGIVGILALVYVAGYRPGPGFTLVKAATLIMDDMPAGTSVYIDGRLRGASHGGPMRFKLVPGTHSVIVDALDNNSWSDAVSLEAPGDTHVRPLLVPSQIEHQPLTELEARKAVATLAAYRLPSESEPLRMSGGCVLVYTAKGRILAKGSQGSGCAIPQYLCVGAGCGAAIVFETGSDLRSVIPYPGRDDVLLISYGSMVAAVEVNPISPQFFASLIDGSRETALPRSDTSIVTIGPDGVSEVRLAE